MYEVCLEARLNDSLANVYDAFVTPSKLVCWFAPNSLKVLKYLGLVESGKSFRIVLQGDDGFQQMATGTYMQVEQCRRLCFTWRWEDTNEISKVNIAFKPLDNNTCLVTLTQSAFREKNDMLMQQLAWMDCFEKLSLYLLSPQIPQLHCFSVTHANGAFFNALPA